MTKEPTIREILENVLFAHHDDISKSDEDNINFAHQEIFKKIPSKREVKKVIKNILRKDNKGKYIQINDVATAIHNLLEERMR